MKGKTWKKAAAFALSLTLVAGMAPANVGSFLTGSTGIVAYAAGSTRSAGTLDELTNAFAEAQAGDTIQLTADITLDSALTVAVGKTVTLDLNGKTITGSSNANTAETATHGIYNNGTLTITDSSATPGTINAKGTGAAPVFNNVGATCTIEKGNFNSEKWYTIKNLGTMTINGGTFNQGDDEQKLTSNASLLVNGWYYGNAETGQGNDGYVAHTGDVVARITINGGTFNHGITTTNCIKNDDWSSALINGGTFNSSNGVLFQATGSGKITGGTFTGFKSLAWFNADGTEKYEPGVLEIEDGTFDVKHIALEDCHTGTLSIKGGKFKISENILEPATNSWTGKNLFTGGVFSLDPADYVATGYKSLALVKDTNNTTYGFGVAATPTIGVTATPSAGITYDGTSKVKLTATPSLEKIGDYTVSYSAYQWQKNTNGNDYANETATGATTANYEVGPTVAATRDYRCKVTSGSTTLTSAAVTAKINKAAPTVTITPKTGLVYNNTDQELVTVSGATTGVEFKYAVTDKSVTEAPTTDSDWTTNIPKKSAVGEYKIWYKAAATDNYAEVTARAITSTVKIEKGAPTITITPTANLTYNGTDKTLATVTNVPSDAVYQFAVTASTATSAPNDGWQDTTIPTKTDAGTYTIWYRTKTADGVNTNYNAVAAKAYGNVTIKKATQTGYTAPDPYVSLTYTGTEIGLLSTRGNVGALGGTMSYAVTTSSTTPSATATNTWKSDASQIRASAGGTYYVWFKIDGTNYELAPTLAGSVYVSAQGTATDPEPTLTAQTWTLSMSSTYEADGNAPKPVIVGNTYGTVTYAYYTSAGTKLSSAPSTAGSYKVVVTASGNSTYDSRSQEKSYTITEPTLAIKTQPTNYTGALGSTAEFEVVATGTGLTYQWQYSTDGTTWTNSGLTGAKTSALDVEVTEARDGQLYRCVVKSTKSSTPLYSNAVSIKVTTAVTTQPTSVTGEIGDTAKFTVKATGIGLTYQWQYNSGDGWKDSGMTGAKTATLSVEVAAKRDGQQYRCVVTSANGTSAISRTAAISVKTAITAQPKDVSGVVGDTAKFTVAAVGADLSYQWQYSTDGKTWADSGMTGAKTATLNVEVAAKRDGQQYRCVVTSANGTEAISSAAAITVKAAITTQPKDYSGKVGDTAKFTVAATGKDLTYQWQYNKGDGWVNSGMTGADTATLNVELAAKRDGQQYRCIVTAANGTKATSNAATISVATAITTQPKDVTSAIGNTVKFTVAATGKDLTYQWQYNKGDGWVNSGMTSAKTATLSVEAAKKRDGQQYRCIVTGADGTKLTSSAATMHVNFAITASPANYSGKIGSTAKFTVQATGKNLTYQWQYNKGDGWVNSGMTGAKTATLSVEVAAKRDGQQYRCIVTAPDGSKLTSSAATIKVK